MSRYNETRFYDDGNYMHDLSEVFARYERGEVVEALYELEKLIPSLKGIHKYVKDKE